MHSLIWFLALLGLTAAAHVRIITDLPEQRGYQEQDTSRNFYSYGYSDENAARAEYTARDGSSRGFYSYVDPNGKLQTVKYEAGGAQGFKAEASNLPKAPVDDKQPPLPVTDTVEVQQARREHLDAIREAQQEVRASEQREAAGGEQQQRLSQEDAEILERVRAELTAMLAERQREEGRGAAAPAAQQQREQQLAEATRQRAAAEERQELREQAEQENRERERESLRTVYTLADISSNSYLKLSDLAQRLDEGAPAGAYYSYVSPDAKYSLRLSKRN
ncbi:hypothetical protein KR222_002377 [Zaprionus bogoriensis]|nr:hypothetical protein KR222_002377 [Zaprionus bogoriensis]